VQENVPKRVAIDLGSGKQQRPFFQMEGYKAEDLVIAVGGSAASMASNTPATSSVDPTVIELSYWETIKNSTSADDFRSYLEKYPDGQFAALAKNRIKNLEVAAPLAEPTTTSSNRSAGELSFWDSIKNSTNVEDFRAYLKRYPNGEFAELAKNRVKAVDDAALKEKEKQEEAKRANDQIARQTKSFNGSLGSMGYSGGTFYYTPGKLVVSPVKVQFVYGDGSTHLFACPGFANAVVDKNVIREISDSMFGKLRLKAESPDDPARMLEAIREVCEVTPQTLRPK